MTYTVTVEVRADDSAHLNEVLHHFLQWTNFTARVLHITPKRE